MTDYLTRLAQRTLGLMPLVEPLIPSRYASALSAPPVEIMTEEQAPEPATLAARLESPSERSAMTPPAPRQRQASPAGGEPAGLESELGQSATVSLSDAVESAPPLQAQRTEPDRLPAGTVASPRRIDPPGNTAVAATATDAGFAFEAAPPERLALDPVSTVPAATVTRASLQPEPTVADTAPGRRAEGISVAIDAAPDADLLRPPAARPITEVPTRPEPVIVLKPDAGQPRPEIPPVEALEQAAADRRLPPSERPLPVDGASTAVLPTVRVTIGRIEVRAVTPSPPPVAAAPRRSGPALSLDDYLKQRNGAQR